MPTATNSTTSASINYVRNNFDTRASVIEGQYYSYAQPGIPNLIREIQACYDRATRSMNVLDIRDCLVVDYTAFNEIQDEARDSHQRAPAFFDNEKVRERLAYYGPLAQFDSVPQMITYLKNTHEIIHGLLLRDDEARRYLYQHLPRQTRTLQ